jgi:hypothetical protein
MPMPLARSPRGTMRIRRNLPGKFPRFQWDS